MNDQTERMYKLMRKESNRLRTFQMNPPWPKGYVDIKKLAKAGFFYTFNGDNVHCAFCRGQVCRWDRDDDPMSEHARHFTTCPFIMGGEVGNEPLGEDPFPGPKRPRPYDVCGPFSNDPPSDSSSSEQHCQLGESANDQYNYSYSENQEQDTHMPRNQQASINQNHLQDRPSPIHEDNLSDNQSRHSLSSYSGSNHSGSSGSLSGICKICYTNCIELVFLPCGHSVSCLSCAQRLVSCPCCRALITTRIRTFLV